MFNGFLLFVGLLAMHYGRIQFCDWVPVETKCLGWFVCLGKGLVSGFKLIATH